jgi:hypothetical protein
VSKHEEYLCNHRLLERARILRDKALAHTDFDTVGDASILQAHSVDLDEVETLLSELHGIVDIYIGFFRLPCTTLDPETSLPTSGFQPAPVTNYDGMLRRVESEFDAYLEFRAEQKRQWLNRLGPNHRFNKKHQAEEDGTDK